MKARKKRLLDVRRSTLAPKLDPELKRILSKLSFGGKVDFINKLRRWSEQLRRSVYGVGGGAGCQVAANTWFTIGLSKHQAKVLKAFAKNGGLIDSREAQVGITSGEAARCLLSTALDNIEIMQRITFATKSGVGICSPSEERWEESARVRLNGWN